MARQLKQQKTEGLAFAEEYIRFAESKRPDLSLISDPVKRHEEILKWLEEMEDPDKLLFDFCQANPHNAVGVLSNKMSTEGKDAISRSEEVKSLPIQDTVWLIDESLDFKDKDGQSCRILLIYDQKDYALGTNSAFTHEKSFAAQCKELICIACLHPMVGVPRRPLRVTMKDPLCAEKAVGLDLSDYGITYMYAGVDHVTIEQPFRMRECCVCHLRGSKGLFKKCSSCQAMLYCSKSCQKADWDRKGPMAPHSHKLWCKKMKGYMAKTEELRKLPFIFADETTSEDFDMEKYKEFLTKNGVYNQGSWRRECQHSNSQHSECACKVPFGELPDADDLIVLPVESTVLNNDPDKTAGRLQDWESYYTFRGLRLDSPVAILLQWPLTLYHVINHSLPNDTGSWWEDLDDKLRIDILGVEKEVDMLPIFKELGFLCPDLSLDIHMYGNEISKAVDGREYQHCNLQIKVIRGLYHRKSSTARKPHVAIGYNAGIGAYQQWSQTLVKLRSDKTPAYFTDYCQYSCECARIAVEGLGLGTTSEPVINPFRNPVRKLAAENDMPWYSNGFLFHLVYP